jgi:hypothetical protein
VSGAGSMTRDGEPGKRLSQRTPSGSLSAETLIDPAALAGGAGECDRKSGESDVGVLPTKAGIEAPNVPGRVQLPALGATAGVKRPGHSPAALTVEQAWTDLLLAACQTVDELPVGASRGRMRDAIAQVLRVGGRDGRGTQNAPEILAGKPGPLAGTVQPGRPSLAPAPDPTSPAAVPPTSYIGGRCVDPAADTPWAHLSDEEMARRDGLGVE